MILTLGLIDMHVHLREPGHEYKETIETGSKAAALAEFGDMKKTGICAVSDDGQPVENSNLMRKALEYAKGLDLPVLSHAEDLQLADNGSMNEGRVATQLGIKGIPNASESIAVKRDIELSRVTEDESNDQ